MTELPPKTCSIERLTTKPEDIERILSGEKQSTRRNGRYADIGEMWNLNGKTFRITGVFRQKISDMTIADFQTEGFESKEEYFAYLDRMHPGMPLQALSNGYVWVHQYEPVAE